MGIITWTVHQKVMQQCHVARALLGKHEKTWDAWRAGIAEDGEAEEEGHCIPHAQVRSKGRVRASQVASCNQRVSS